MYTPTKKELDNLGFKELKTKGVHLFLHDYVDYFPNLGVFKSSGERLVQFHPKSFEDLKTLIRILNPQ